MAISVYRDGIWPFMVSVAKFFLPTVHLPLPDQHDATLCAVLLLSISPLGCDSTVVHRQTLNHILITINQNLNMIMPRRGLYATVCVCCFFFLFSKRRCAPVTLAALSSNSARSLSNSP